MAAGDLTTLTNALSWVGAPQDDGNGNIARLITALSTQIQTFLGYQVASLSYNKSFNGVGGRTLLLPDRPITAVASLAIDGVTVPASSGVYVPGFVFDTKALYLRCYEFCRGVQNIAVSYTAGYASVPSDIEQACLDWIKLIYEGKDQSPGLTKIKAGDSEIDNSPVITALGATRLLMPPIVAAALQPYRRVALT